MELTPYHQLSGPPTRNNDDENTNFLEDTETGPIKRQRNRQIFQWRTRGWKFTLHMASLAGIFVLALNLGFILWAVPRHNVGKYRGVLYDGNCDRVHNLSIGLHLVINILSTTLLGASNYTMQCLGAPTREDIDKAHGAKRWLDIGVPSAKNLKQVSRTRLVLWVILVFSSLPLHLMYNSTIFPTVSANEYNVFLGEGSFGDISLEDIKLNEISRYRLDSPEYNLTSSFNRLHEKAKKRTLKQLDNQMCVNAYATTYQTTYGSLLLVSNDTGNANEYFAIDHQQIFNPGSYKRTLPPDSDPYRWLCPKQESDNAQDCRKFLPDIRSQIADGTWTVNSHHVASCLAEVAPPHCKLQYSLPLMTVVVVFIAIKATVICYVSFRKEVPILTVGDAVASFIKSPDKLARGQCLISMKDVRRCIEGAYPEWPHYEKLRFDDKPKQWRAAVPWGRWSFGIISYCISIFVCIILLAHGFNEMNDSSGIWTAGLQALDSRTLITGVNWPTSLISNTLIANLPQLIYSVLYFAVNSIITTMTLASEWSRYAFQRKGLRVSSEPRMSQRSTYFLSLPYRYALPLIGTSGILHWLISQSLFLVGIEAYTADLKHDPASDLNTCGYSPVAIVCSILVGAAMVASLVGLSFKRFKSGMPVAGSCSLAIAAACYPADGPVDDSRARWLRQNLEFLPLQWGVISSDGEFGHCSFSCEDVSMPKQGKAYK